MGVLDLDRRVFALGLARMVDAIGNSVLIVVLPLYIASGQVPIDALVGTRVGAFGLTLTVTEYLLGGASGAYAVVSSYWLMVGLRVVQGVGAAFTIPCTVALVTNSRRAGTAGATSASSTPSA